MEYELDWSKGYTFKELLNSNSLRDKYAKVPGVYIHTDHRVGRVAYIGKTSGNPGLWERQYTHYAFLIGGLYVVPELDPESEKYSWIPGPKQHGVLETVFCQAKFQSIVQSAFRYAESIRIHLCPIEKGEASKIIERELLYAFEPLDTEWGTKSEPGHQVRLINNCKNIPDLQKLFRRKGSNISFKTDGPNGPQA